MINSSILSRKEHISDVAKTLFREKGYSATSMRDLANAVGIEAASLYSHIKSKEAILQLICFNMAEEFLTVAEQIQKTDLPADEKFAKAVEAHLSVITKSTDVVRSVPARLAPPERALPADFKIMRRRYEDYFKRIIERGVQDDLFSIKDEKLTVFTILTSLNGLYEWYDPKGKLTPTEIAANMTEIFLKGILNNKPHPRGE